MFNWEVNSVRVSKNDFKTAEDQFEQIKSMFEVDNQQYILYPLKDSLFNLFFYDNEKIKGELSFSEFLIYYGTKNMKNVEKSTIKNLIFNGNLLHLEIIDNIDLYYKEIEDLIKYNSYSDREHIENISPFIFQYIITDYDILNYVEELLSLMLISDKVSFNNHTIETEIRCDSGSSISFCIPWREWGFFGNSKVFFKCLSWILSENEGGINVRLKSTIVKNSIINYSNNNQKFYLDENLSDIIINNIDKTLQLVVSDRTAVYFKMVETIKEDWINEFRKQDEINQRFNSSFTSLLIVVFSSFSIEYVTSDNIKAFSDLFENKEFMKYITFVAFIGCLIIASMFFYSKYTYLKYTDAITSINKETYGTFDIDNKIKPIKFCYHYIVMICLAILVIIMFLKYWLELF